MAGDYDQENTANAKVAELTKFYAEIFVKMIGYWNSFCESNESKLSLMICARSSLYSLMSQVYVISGDIKYLNSLSA